MKLLPNERVLVTVVTYDNFQTMHRVKIGDMLFETNMFIDVMDIDYLPFAFTLIFVIETGWHFCEVVGPLETHIMA